MNVRIKIADTVLEIISQRPIDIPLYSNFRSENNFSADIQVEILESHQGTYGFAYENKTHVWIEQGNEYIMLFSHRGTFLDKCSPESIWMLSTDGSVNKWNLYIPMLNQMPIDYLNAELQYRPWLQRLMIMYYMHSNFAVLHGALCSIEGIGCLFLGDSGVGKSTMCSLLSNKYNVYSDDRVVIKIDNNKLIAYGTPWNIKNQQYCSNKCALIERIYFLNHGDNLLLRFKVDYSLLFAIMKQILHSSLYSATDIFNWKCALAEKIGLNCPGIYSFAFTPDETCIRYLIGEKDAQY